MKVQPSKRANRSGLRWGPKDEPAYVLKEEEDEEEEEGPKAEVI